MIQNATHSDEVQDIISTPPSWLIRWGTILFFLAFLIIGALSAFIQYPDTIKTRLTINSANSSKPISTHISGRLTSLMVKNNEHANNGQFLAYIESTAEHVQVLNLLAELKMMQEKLSEGEGVVVRLSHQPKALQLGEIQTSYQNFYQYYLAYNSSVAGGLYLKRKAFLQKDLTDIMAQREVLLIQRETQAKELELAKQEYAMHQKLTEQKVEAPMELKRQESLFLSKQSSFYQTGSQLISNNSAHSAKEKEIIELVNQIKDESLKFYQALNSLISEIEKWKKTYVISAPEAGMIQFVGSLEEGQPVNTNQQLFYISSGNTNFFGEMVIPQTNIGKVRLGQEVLIKLKGYPFEEYGILKGKIISISDLPFRDSIFFSQVALQNTNYNGSNIHLKQGMLADAEIITQDATLLQRLSRNLIKMIN